MRLLKTLTSVTSFIVKSKERRDCTFSNAGCPTPAWSRHDSCKQGSWQRWWDLKDTRQAETQAAAAVYAVMMCGHTTPELEAEWGDYGDMAIKLLRDANREEKWLKYNVVDDEFPEEQQWQTFKGIVLTGSKHDAFADDKWIVRLRSLMRREAQRGTRILGICFGSQLLAMALGGRAGRAGCGWELGSRPMTLLPTFFQQSYSAALPEGGQLNVHESHQDQVLELPPGAELLATSSQTPIEIWQLGGTVLGIQGHPEFSQDFQFVLNQRHVELGNRTLEQKQLAKEEMQRFPVTPQNAQELADVLKLFLKQL